MRPRRERARPGEAGAGAVGRTGRPGSFEEFVAARSTALFRLAYLLTGTQADAEDLVQTTLLKLYVGWRKVAAADSAEAYARRTLTNTFLSGRRSAATRHERLVTAPPDLPTVHHDVEDRLTLWPHVRDLPPRQRAVIVLRYVADLSEAEIAETLGCAPGTVKSTAAAAMRNLRARLAADADAPNANPIPSPDQSQENQP